jgi:RNA:NAD 2'-phosphotransferase (TPT1/KptA family)
MNFQVIAANALAPIGASRLVPSHNELAKLAYLHPKLETKKHAKLVLRHNGFSSNPNTVEGLFARLEQMLDVRRARLSKCTPHTSHESLLLQRLAQWRISAVIAAAKPCLRHGAAGGYSMRVKLTSDARAIDYMVTMGSNRNTYGGSFKGWQASEDHHRITVPVDWRTRVLKRGLAAIGGMLTLTAQRLVSHGDIELYQATWVEQGRGYQVNVRHGTIAMLDDESFHAEDPQKAINGVLRKVEQARGSAQPTKRNGYELNTQEFILRYERYRDLDVHVEDALDVGACEFGVRSWCQRVGIDIEQGFVPLRCLLEGFSQCPLIEVRRTVLHVVAEHRARQRFVSKRAAFVVQLGQ